MPVRRPPAFVAAWHREPPMPASRDAAADASTTTPASTATPTRSTRSRARASSSTSWRDRRSASRRCARLGAYANVFAIESFMDELAPRPGARSARVPAAPSRRRARARGARRRRPSAPAGASRCRRAGRGSGLGVRALQEPEGVCRGRRRGSRSTATAARSLLERAVIAADAGRGRRPDGLANQLEGG